MAGALRQDELQKLETSDVEDLGSKFLVTIKASKTHTNRIFTVVGNNHLILVRRYISLRPAHTPHKRFFIFYKYNKCSVQPVGIHTLSKLPSRIATFLKLEQPRLYTGHCFRRSSASILSDSGADFAAIKRLGGWKSTAVAEGYIENSLQNKTDVAEKILSNTVTKAPYCGSTSAETIKSIQDIELNVNSSCQTFDKSNTSMFSFAHCSLSNVNINIYKQSD